MAKSVVAKNMSISLENCVHGKPYIRIIVPVEYTFFDFLQIIKICTGYSDNYKWEVFLPHYGNSNILNHYKKTSLDEIKLIEYFESYPNTIWKYGSIEIGSGWRSNYNYKKSYPSVQIEVGTFPTEEEFMKKIKIKNIDQLHKDKEDFKGLDEKLKDYFTSKYKISDQPGADYNGHMGNKLIRI